MSSSSLGEAVLDLVADGQQLVGDIEDAKPGVLGALDNLGKVGGALLAAGLGVAITALTGITAMIWDAGNTLDGAYDKILITTGKAGPELEALQKSFETVFANVPTDADSAATAVAGLNQRLGMTGPILEVTSENLLDMTRLTGGDLQTNLAAFTRMMQDASIKNEDGSKSLDAVFVAGQKTGIGLDRLMQLLAQFGVPMRQLGFSFTESAALMGKWEKEGVNTELVLSSLKIATAGYAKEHIPLREGLDATMKAIKNAKSESDALNIAIETFGAKSGPDMAAAIRENRFELGDLVGALQNSEAAIFNTSEATMDWGERWQLFKNRMTVALGPAGARLMSAVSTALAAFEALMARPEIQNGLMAIVDGIVALAEAAANALPGVIDGFFAVVDWLKANEGVVVAVLAALGVAFIAFGVSVAIAAWTAMAPLLPVIAIMLLVAGVAYLVYEAWKNNWGGIQEKTDSAIAFVKKVIAKGLAAIQAFWAEHGDEIMKAVEDVWNSIVTTVTTAIKNIKKLIKDGMNFIRQLNDGELGWLSDLWKNTWNMIERLVADALKFMKGLMAAWQAASRGDWYAFGQELRKMWDAAWDALETISKTATANLSIIIKKMIDDIVRFFNTTDWQKLGWGIINGVISGVLSLQNSLYQLMGAIVQTIAGFFGLDWNKIGQDIINGVLAGVIVTAGLLNDKISNLVAKAAGYFSDHDWVQEAKNIINGLIAGLQAAQGWLYDAFIQMVKDIIAGMLDLFGAGGSDTFQAPLQPALAGASFGASAFGGVNMLRGSGGGQGQGSGMAVTFYAPVSFDVANGDTLESILRELR